MEKEALKELRRLNKLEKEQRETKIPKRTSSSDVSLSRPASSSADPLGSAEATGAQPMEPEQDEEIQNLAALHPTSNLTFLFLTPSKEGNLLVAKPVKTKGGEFSMREATSEVIEGFKASDIQE